MDGTLVDSTAIVERAWGWWARRHNIPLDELLTFSHGRPTIETMRHYRPGVDNGLDLAEMIVYEEAQTDGIVPIPGAIAAVAAVAGSPWAVVTSANRNLAEIRLGLAGLPVPKVLVATDDIQCGKPHPECFLLAANRLGVDPSACLVFEDTGPGVNAGLRAGMKVVGLLTTVPRDQLATPYLIRDFRDVSITRTSSGLEVLIACDRPCDRRL